jgi:hypothetical protein
MSIPSNNRPTGFKCIDIKGLIPKSPAFTDINGMGNPTWYWDWSVISKGKR